VIEHVRLEVVQLELRLPPELAEKADAVYPLIAAPPFDNGATQDTTAAVGLPTTETCCGEPGAAAGVDVTEVEEGLVPIALVARS
jgi:hypothetical protein